jgi:hypothetical protein
MTESYKVTPAILLCCFGFAEPAVSKLGRAAEKNSGVTKLFRVTGVRRSRKQQVVGLLCRGFVIWGCAASSWGNLV